jgi:hypothetical protein
MMDELSPAHAGLFLSQAQAEITGAAGKDCYVWSFWGE